MKLIFMGTPEFSVPTLRALYEAGHEIVGVYTQPDKEKGRGKKLEMSPVKIFALEHELPVFQPKSLKGPKTQAAMAALGAECMVVAAYGKILPAAVLTMSKYGCINVHASLLPSFRGAAPIEWAILSGRNEAGVTIMQMDEGIDTGDMLARASVEITPEDSGDSLTEKLSGLGGDLIVKVLSDAENGLLKPEKQPAESDTPYASMLSKEMGLLDFSEPAETVLLRMRAFDSRPSAYTSLQGKSLKLFKGTPTSGNEEAPGTVIEVTKKYFTVNCGRDAIRVTELQLEGKKRMPADAFLRGYPLAAGTVLGE